MTTPPPSQIAAQRQQQWDDIRSQIGAMRGDEVPPGVAEALGRMKVQAPSEYLQLIEEKFWELTGATEVKARGAEVTVTEGGGINER